MNPFIVIGGLWLLAAVCLAASLSRWFRWLRD
jgi:hypothetical protein